MPKKYLQYRFSKLSNDPDQDWLIAMLDGEGFTGFDETGEELIAYLPENERNDERLRTLLDRISMGQDAVDFNCDPVPDINWNEKWERGFHPVEIDGRVRLHASFHKREDGFEYNILIDPKMSFGTGHHQTTRMMVRAMLDEEFEGNDVLDLGAGTGVLSILALKRGAKSVLAADIDEWAFMNCKENLNANDCDSIEVLHGGMERLTDKNFDIILANINRNILLEQMQDFYLRLRSGGVLLLSGIMEADRKLILDRGAECGFSFIKSYTEGDWIALSLRSMKRNS